MNITKKILNAIYDNFLNMVIVSLLGLIGSMVTYVAFYTKENYSIIKNYNIPHITDLQKQDAVENKIDDLLRRCQTQGVFIGWMRIETVDEKCSNENCVTKTLLYFHKLKGVWHNNPEPENTKYANPLYTRVHVVDRATMEYFVRIFKKDNVIFINEEIAKTQELGLLRYIYNNLGVKQQDESLEGIYIKIATQNKYIWLFSLSFTHLKDGKCYSKKTHMLSSSVLQELVDHTKAVYNVK